MPLPAHVEWIASNQADALAACLHGQDFDLQPRQALAILVEADPSPGARAVQWLCNALIAGGMRWEDVAAGSQSKAAQTLTAFAQYRRTLPQGSRNLEDHAGLAEVYRAVAPMLEQSSIQDSAPIMTVGGRELRRQQRAAALEDSLVLHQSPHLILAVPTTESASSWWGRGTRWCTAAREHNYFDHYNQRAPLIVVCMPDALCNATLQKGAKLQLHLGRDGGDVQFMDADDADVTPEYVEEHWGLLGGLVCWAAGRSANMFSMIPVDELTEEICYRAVQVNPNVVENLSLDLLSERVCLAAVLARPFVLEDILEEARTPAVYALAVQGQPLLLECVPAHLRTTEMCMGAMTGNQDALGLVHQGDRTPELCLAAVRLNGRVLRHVPMQYRTRELCMAAVQQNGGALEHVPHALRDAAMYRAGVTATPSAIKLVPDLATNPDRGELYRLVAGSGGFGLMQVPVEYRTREVYLAAVTASGVMLASVPVEMRERDICMAAVGHYGCALRVVPPELVDEAMCTRAVRSDGDVIEFVPPNLLTPELCMLALATKHMPFTRIPSRHLTVEVCLRAIELTPHSMMYVPGEVLTPEFYRRAAAINPTTIDHAPLSMRPGLRAQFPERICAPEWNKDTYFADLPQSLAAHPVRPILPEVMIAQDSQQADMGRDAHPA